MILSPIYLKVPIKAKPGHQSDKRLPVNGTIHTIQQDNINPNLLFAGSEFGFYFSVLMVAMNGLS